MKPLFSRTHESFYSREFGQRARREILLNTATDGFTPRAIQRAIKRVGKAGIVDLGPGKFPGLTLDRMVELVSREQGLTVFSGTIQIQGGPVVLKGIRFQAAANAPAIIVRSGTLLCEDCEFLGSIEVQGTGSLFLKNCLLSTEGVSLALTQKARAEVIGSRISGRPAGIILADAASCALLACRLERCAGAAPGETGSAIFCDTSAASPLVIEGTEFFNNQVGLYIKSASPVHIQGSHFRGQSASSIIRETTPPNSEIVIRDSLIESPETCDFPALSLGGGRIGLTRVRVASPAGIGLSAAPATLDVESSRFSSKLAAAADVQGGMLTSKESFFVSDKAPGLRLDGTKGAVSGGAILGNPPVSASEPNEVLLTGVSFVPPPAEEQEASPAAAAPLTIQSITAPLSEIIGQVAVKTEIERLLRLAFAARERRKQGLPQDAYNYSGILTGPPQSGQFRALEIFASGLHLLGEIDSPEVRVIPLPELLVLAPESADSGLLLVIADETQRVTLLSPGVADAILRLNHAREGRAHLFIEGDRDSLQSFLRSRLDLAREFVIELPFAPFDPTDLAALFAGYCQREKIRLSLDASKKIPVIFHSLHDRLQRRFLNVDGVQEIFSTARRNYLDRCSREGRFDLEMGDMDIVIPMDQKTSATIERSAELVSICPACNARNPWLPGLAPMFHCGNCGVEFEAPWGFLRDSTFLRKRSLPHPSLRTGAVAKRRIVAAHP